MRACQFCKSADNFSLMRPVKTLLSCVLMFTAAVSVSCHAASPEGDTKAQWGRFENGFRYVLYPNKNPKSEVVMRLYVGSGSLMETDAQRGLAHFLEHMAFNGTAHFPAGQMVEYFQRIGMAFGSDTNAHTGFDETVYKLNLPSADPKIVADSLTLLRDYADGMALDSKEIERERGVILSEKRTRDTPDYRQFESFYTFRFAGNTLADRLPIGVEDVIEKSPRESFAQFYAQWYHPSRMVLLVVGDFDAAKMKTDIRKIFDSPFANKTPAANFSAQSMPEAGPLRVGFSPQAQTRSVKISFSALRPYGEHSFSREDTLENRARILHTVAALQIVENRLKRRMQQADTPINNAYAYFWELPAQSGILENVGVECEPARWKDALSLLDTEVRRALRFGFTPDEIEEARATIENELRSQADKADTRFSAEIADAILDSLGDHKVFMDPREQYAISKPVLAAMNNENLVGTLDGFWNGAAQAVHISGPIDLTAQAGQAEASALLKQLSAQPLTPPEARAKTEFAYAQWGTPGVVAQTLSHPQVGVTQIRFANEARLNLKRTNFEAGTALVLVRAGSGILLPAGASALPQAERERIAAMKLLAQMAFLKGGLQAHPYEDFERISTLNGWNEQLRFTCEDDAFSFAVKVPARALPFTLNAIAAYLAHPAYREDALGQARAGIEQIYRNARQTLEGVISDRGARYLADGDGRFGLPPESLVQSLTMADLASWIQPQLTSGYLEISLVGDFDEDSAIKAAAASFGALPLHLSDAEFLRQFPAEVNRLRYPAAGPKAFTCESDAPRAVSMVLWPTCDAWDTPRVRALNVLGEVFSDRLRLRVRQKMGDAYSPYAYNRSSEIFAGRGLFQGVSLVRPDRIGDVAQAMEEIARELSQSGVTDPDEFKRALAPFAQQVDRQLQQNDYWINGVLKRSWLHPELLTRPLTLKSGYMDMKVDAVNALAKEYLTPEKSMRLQVAPAAAPVQ